MELKFPALKRNGTFSFHLLAGLRSMSDKSQSISKAEDKIFLVDVETILRRLLFASMKLLSWNKVLEIKRIAGTFESALLRPNRSGDVTNIIVLRPALPRLVVWPTRRVLENWEILNFACPSRSKTVQKFSFTTPQWQAMDIIYPSLGGARLKTKFFPLLLLLCF